jgi:hypothetical protein
VNVVQVRNHRRGDFPAGSVYLQRFMAGVSTSKVVFSNRVKVARFLIKPLRYQNTVFGWS